MGEHYTMLLGVSEDADRKWERHGFFAYVLVAPDGSEQRVELDSKEPVKVSRGEDCHFAAVVHCTHLLPDEADLEVISAQEHYHGGATYQGPLNKTPTERRAEHYTNKDGKTPIHNAEHLKAMDTVLEKRGITTSGRRPDTPEERSLVRCCKGWAKAALERHGDAGDDPSPEDY
jgi:hypothetical protein